jgi:hypothetical protein
MPKNNTDKSLVFNDESQSNSYGFKIPSKGIGLERFKKNPVMLADHRNSLDSILGSFSDVKKVEGLLQGTPVFDSENEATAEIERKYNNDFIKSCSMGITFNHEDMVFIDDVLVLKKCELMEVSLVAIPSNRNSVRLYANSSDTEPMTEDQVKQLCLSLQPVTDHNNIKSNNKNENMKIKLLATVLLALGYDASVTEVEQDDLNEKVLGLSAKLTAANDQVSAFKLAAEQANLTAINKQVDLAVTAGQIDATKKETFVNLGIADGELLTATLAAIPTKKSLNAIIEAEKTGASEVNSVDEFAALSTEKQLAFKKQDPEGYKKLFTKN